MEYKGYFIDNDGVYGYKEIKPIGRGSVPLNLRGQYTTVFFAQRAIDHHLFNKKGNTNAEASISD